MTKTNRTYGVYVTNETMCGRIGTGTKTEMRNLFDLVKNDPQYELVSLIKWSVRYNCWYHIEKVYKQEELKK
jgi:hypothetical protein